MKFVPQDIRQWLLEPDFKPTDDVANPLKHLLQRYIKVDYDIHIHDPSGYISLKDIFDEVWKFAEFHKVSMRCRASCYDRFKEFIELVYPHNYYEKLNYQVSLLQPNRKGRKQVCAILAQVYVRDNKYGRFYKVKNELSFAGKLDDEKLAAAAQAKVDALGDDEVLKLSKKFRIDRNCGDAEILRGRLLAYYVRY